MVSLWSAMLFLQLSVRIALAQGVDWVSPRPAGSNGDYDRNPTLTIGNTFNMHWETTRDDYQIIMWQQNLYAGGSAAEGDSVYIKQFGGPEVSEFSWTVTPQAFDLTQSNVFYFALGPRIAGDAEAIATCHYFNMTEAPVSLSSSTATSSTAPPSSSTAAPSSKSLRASATASSAASTSSKAQSDGHNSTERLGLGLGLGLGIPLILILLGILGLMMKRRRRKSSATHPPAYTSVSEMQPYPSEHPPTSPKEVPADERFFHEMSSGNDVSARHELPGKRDA